MSAGNHRFRQNDLARALRSAKQAGLRRPEIQIDPRSGLMTVRDRDAEADKDADNKTEDLSKLL
jgi:hypothetical protein